MRFFQIARQASRANRIALFAMLAMLAANAYAHASHGHDESGAPTALHAKACAYCVTFGALADAPSAPTTQFPPPIADLTDAADEWAFIARATRTAAQPRAPPHLTSHA